MLKVKQQRFILRLALYLLQANGYYSPKKKQVLNFIKFKNLMKISECEKQKRYEDDLDEIWENDIAWKRKDLFDDGLVDSPERGKWRLTRIGIEEIESKKESWKKLKDLQERNELLATLDYFTGDTVDWMIKVAQGGPLPLKSDGKFDAVDAVDA